MKNNLEDEEEDVKLKTIEEMYDKYKQKRSHLKKHLIMEGVRFDIYKEYEIIDLGIKTS